METLIAPAQFSPTLPPEIAKERRVPKLAAMVPALPPKDRMMRAFLVRDPAAEGIFLVGVKTTGIFCRPTCRARKPKPANVEFFATASQALHGGYRACKLCRPMDAVQPPPPLVQRLRDAVERDPTGRLTEKELLQLKIDPSTARRQFRKYYGMTFHAYQRARRMGLALKDVKAGSRVIDAQLDRGFESGSGFRDAFAKIFGEPPRRAAVTASCLWAQRIDTPLGTVLGLADDRGLHVLDFVDRRGLERKLALLRKKYGAAIVPGEHPHLRRAAEQLAEYFAGERREFQLTFALSGSEWEKRVWAGLLDIPYGQTKSYSQLAAELGEPRARRAVGRANGLNFLCIVIPCHRVIRADGSLCGYGGGLWRKQWLLAHERKHAEALEH